MAESENIQNEKPAENIGAGNISADGNLSEKNILSEPEITATEITNPSQSENMEVHKHPHHVTHKKKWGEYLLEFSMLFLAVYLGFVAENVREHSVERNKEIKTIVSFKNELQKDTARLNKLINIYIPSHNLYTDSALNLINTANIKGNEKIFFKTITNATAWNLYATPEIALNIFKNSGLFNLIENTELKTEILKYDAILKSYTNYSNFISTVQHTVDTSTLAFFQLKNIIDIFPKMYRASLKDGQIFITDRDVPDVETFKTYDKIVFLAFAKKLEQITQLLNDMNVQYLFIRDQEVKLLKSIDKEYPG